MAFETYVESESEKEQCPSRIRIAKYLDCAILKYHYCVQVPFSLVELHLLPASGLVVPAIVDAVIEVQRCVLRCK